MPGLRSQNSFGTGDYLLVLGAAGAFVLGVVVEVSVLWLQPATTPNKPNSTIRVNNLFIFRVTFTRFYKRTSKNFMGKHP